MHLRCTIAWNTEPKQAAVSTDVSVVQEDHAVGYCEAVYNEWTAKTSDSMIVCDCVFGLQSPQAFVASHVDCKFCASTSVKR